MKKITIIETDYHGCGYYCYGDLVNTYAYDDGCTGDLKEVLKNLIAIGFIPKDMVEIYTIEEAVRKLNAE